MTNYKITIGNESYDVLNHISEIKEELGSIDYKLKRFYNKKQFFNWLDKETNKLKLLYNNKIVGEFNLIGNIVYSAVDEDNNGLCWFIEGYDIANVDFTDQKNINAFHEIKDTLMDYCFVEDDNKRLLLLIADVD